MLLLIFSFVTILFSDSSTNLSSKAPIVSTSRGIIIGHYKTSNEGKQYEAFEGISFALPPTGDRRFEVRLF